MKYFISGVIGGVISVVMSFVWFLLGAMFMYGITKPESKSEKTTIQWRPYDKKNY